MKKNILVWSLYDFANSIIMIVFLFYFSQWLVVDMGKPDWWYNVTLMASSGIFIIVAPYLTSCLDKNKKKLAGVRATTAIMFVFYAATAIVMLFFPSQAILAAIFFTLSMSVYLLSFIYYTPMMNDISNDQNRGWISGLGMGANYAGHVFGLLVTLPFATGAIYLFGAHGRPQTLIPAMILSAIASLPLLFMYKEPQRDVKQIGPGGQIPTALGGDSSRSFIPEAIATLKKIFSIRNLALLIIAYFLFSDALLTFSNNFPIFLEKVFHASDSIKAYLNAGILFVSGIGSVVIGRVSDRKGTRWTLIFILIVWIILFPLLALSTSFVMASIVCLVAGFFYGPTWAVSRAMVSEYTPREVEASAFGIYTVAERFATFIGPVVWSVILARTASQGTISYSYAIIGMGVLVLVGLFFVIKIKKV